MTSGRQTRRHIRSTTALDSNYYDPSASVPLGRQWYVFLLLAAAGLLAPSLFYPFGRDQGVFASAGSVILNGGWPYRDVWDLKPPGVYYTYAVMLACGGGTMFGVRALDLVAAVLTVCLLYSALRRLASREAAWLGALLYAALYLRLGFWGMAQAESYANLWTTAALAAWLRAGSPGTGAPGPGGATAAVSRMVEAPLPAEPVASSAPGRASLFSLAAGMAAAAALMLKVTSLPSLVVIMGTVAWLRARGMGWGEEGRRIGWFALGLIVPIGIVLTAMAASSAGAAYLEIQRGFVAGYVSLQPTEPGTASSGWRYFWRLYGVPAVLIPVGLWAAIPRGRLVLSAWLTAAIGSVLIQQKYFGYHWTPVLLPLAGLAGTGLVVVLKPISRLSRHPARVLGVAGALLILGWSVQREANGYHAAWRLMTGRISQESYWARFGRPYRGDFSFLSDLWAARYLRAHTRPEDPVYIWGFEPLTLFLAGRQSPSRFIFSVPLVSPWAPERWRVELLGDLQAHPPALFGVMRGDAIPHASGSTDDSAAALEQFPALRDFLRQGYRYETTIEDLTLYRRLSPDAARP